MFKEIDFRTNNVCESYNKRLNNLISKPNPNLYKIIDLIKDEECLQSTSYDRANLGKTKFRKTVDMLKDKNIECLKIRYDLNDLEVMDYLLELTKFVKEFE